MTPQYDDLVIHFTREPSGPGHLAQIVSSPVGRSNAVDLGPSLFERSSDFWPALESAILRSAEGVRDARAPAVGRTERIDPEGLGRELFEALFTGSLRETYLRAYAAATSQDGRGLRVILEVDPELSGEIGALPWELLYHFECRTFLGRSVRTPLVRRLQLNRSFTPLPIPRLRILVLLADPEGVTRLDVAREKDLITDALGSMEGVELDFLERPTLGKLRDRVRRQPFDVLHFVGHGGFNLAGEGVLHFEDKDRQALEVTGSVLAETLIGFGEPARLVFLNACNTARLPRANQGQDPYQGVASALLMAGVSAVIAMQFPISDRAALCFSSELYRALTDGDPLESAVVESRLALHRSRPASWEWATPVLFLGVPTGNLFEITPSATSVGAGKVAPQAEFPPARSQEERVPRLPNLDRSLDLLDFQRYEAAIEALSQALEGGEEGDTILFYRALSRLGGQRPRSARPDVIRQIEEDLWQAGHRVRGQEPARLWLFRALIQHDYYRLNGLRLKPPTVEELLAEAQLARVKEDPVALQRLLDHAPTPPSPVRQAIEDRLGALGGQ